MQYPGMPDTPDTVPTQRLQVTVTVPMIEFMERLRQSGLYGSTLAEVARQLLSERLRELK